MCIKALKYHFPLKNKLVLSPSVPCLSLTPSASLPVKTADSPITGKLGTSVVLPCWVEPSEDVSSMEVRWYRPQHFNTPILFYQNKNFNTESQDENYRNRTSLAQRNILSTGLKGGDVSLKLDNLNAGDDGAFHCYVSGDKEYGTATMTLNVHGEWN